MRLLILDQGCIITGQLVSAMITIAGFPGGSHVKNLPAVQETRAQSLDREDPLEKGMATHSSILAWRILWTEEPGGLQSMESQRIRHDRATYTHTHHRYCVIFLLGVPHNIGETWSDKEFLLNLFYVNIYTLLHRQVK